jgi:4-hydroxymandelate oxidase
MNIPAALPAGLVSLGDHEAHAQTVLDANAWAYFSGTAADGVTHRANRRAWDALTLLPRVLQPLSGSHTRVELLGRTLAFPVLVAPVAYQRMAHPEGELGTALAAAAQEAGMLLSTQSSVLMEKVAQAVAPDPLRGPLWFQLYWQSDRGMVSELIARAQAAGFEALVLTVDAPVSGARDAERRVQFRLPAGVSAVNLRASPAASRTDMDNLRDKAPGWSELTWLVSQTKLPVIVKGVLHPADAVAARDAGAAAVIVSNHGGRTLDSSPATAVMLPRIADAVGASLPLLVDGGIRRGTDVLKAMALGARAVLVGRPAVWGLANAGPLGVAHVLRLLRDELEIAMALCGCTDLAKADASLLGPPHGT